MRMIAALLLAAVLADAADPQEKEPGTRSAGEVHEWKSKEGLVYTYFLPKRFEPDVPINLTIVLHGSNLSRHWGFANHKAGEFRPDDLVVCPDGTTANGQGGFNFLNDARDLKRLHALHEELRKQFQVRATFLYGHSQGSFFAFLYAGEYPDEVQGVVGHASGVWTNTRLSKAGHAQAIVLMHGTQDPVVPYGQSAGGYDAFLAARYSMVRLCSLEGWNHWPAEHNGPVPHTSQELAWCEGMTTKDAERLAVAFAKLADIQSPERHDYAALYGVAGRVLEREDAPAVLRRKAEKAREMVEKLAQAHADAMPEATKYDGKEWIGHLPMFLRAFAGVPARETLAETWKKILAAHEKEANAGFQKYWKAMRAGKVADAFEEGVKALVDGFLHSSCANEEFLTAMEGWEKEGKKLKLSARARKQYGLRMPGFRSALRDGAREFDALNRKMGKF